MNAKQKRYLIVDQGLIPVTANVVINALIAWLLFRSAEAVPLWGVTSVMGDSLMTVFLLTAINAAIVTATVRRAAGKKPELLTSAQREHYAWMRWWPASNWQRSLMLGGLATAALLPLFWAIFALAGISQLAPMQLVIFKAVYVLLLTAPLLPAVAWAAVCDVAQRPQLSH